MNKQRVLYSIITVSIVCVLVIHCSRKDDLQKGVEALEKGDYAKALDPLRASLILDSLNPEAHYNLARAYIHLDSTEQACRHYHMLYRLSSPFINDIHLKEMLSRALNLNPYPLEPIPMKKMNQFKGVCAPDCRSIAVAAAKRDIANIYLIEPTGRIITQITKRGMNTDPDFSPTGNYIAFASDADGDDEIYIYNIETKDVINLTNNTAKDFSPSFSLDGQEIVFISNMDNEYKWEIYRMGIDGQSIKRLTDNTFWDGFPRFTPDGKNILFSSKRNGSENIYIMNRNGGGEKVFYASESDDNDPQLFGDYLYFKSNRSGEWVIYRYNMKTEEIMALTNEKYPSWNPRISPDGSHLVLARKVKTRWQLYCINCAIGIPAAQIIETIESRYDVMPEPESEKET